MAARWGYSTNVLGWEMLNEFYGSDSQGVREWHDLMGGTFQGTVRPAYLPEGHAMDLGAQPHLATSSNGQPFLSNRRGIDWSHPEMSLAQFHRYPAPHQWGYPDQPEDWGYFQSDGSSLDRLGSDLARPWYDGAIDVDCTARVMFLKRDWQKPLVWGEFGLINDETDWHDAYATDTTARSIRRLMWPGAFSHTILMPWKCGLGARQVGLEQEQQVLGLQAALAVSRGGEPRRAHAGELVPGGRSPQPHARDRL